MALTAISSIIVPPKRQRQEMGDITSLANSLKKIGLINPIVVEPDEVEVGMFCLIAGERRLRAAKSLQWTEIETSLLSELDPALRALVELEENIRRKQLTWPEECQAILKYHTLAKKNNTEVARDLGLSENWLNISLVVARNLSRYPQILSASALRPAYAQLQTTQERENESLIEGMEAEVKKEAFKPQGKALEEDLLQELASVKAVETETPAYDVKGVFPVNVPSKIYTTGQLSGALPESDYGVLKARIELASTPPVVFCQSFQEWAASYSGPRFNFVHCDFPYGLNMDKETLQNSRPQLKVEGEIYDDSPELFLELLSTLLAHKEKLFATSSHLMFWTAFKNYAMVQEMFEDAGFRVCETPLIWHKTDNRGIAPDVRRWPRRTYEVCLFASSGDRKLVNLRAASIAWTTANDMHISAKPAYVLQHFFAMIVDKTTEMLDPTCGSGTALEAAAALGANRIVGVEKERRYAKMSEEAHARGAKLWDAIMP